jgi:hypothetical protein
MKKELELKLVEKYPNLYKEYGGSIHETCMGWGMTCGDGWFDLIDKLSEKLEPMGIVAAQVKEKFGGLRFYINPSDSDTIIKAQKLIQEAESKSFKICERCGKPGKTGGRGWIRTLCDECRNKD